MRDHTIDISRLATTGSRPNSAHTATRWGDSDPTTHPTATVYSTLLALRDSVCKRSGSQPQGCTDTVAQESTEMSLLRNEETKLRAQSSSGQQLEPQLSGRSEREANAGYSSTAAMNEAIGGHVHPSNSRQLLTQGAAMVTRQRSHDAGTRHQSHDVHKLHDDDDGEEEEADSPPQLPGQASGNQLTISAIDTCTSVSSPFPVIVHCTRLETFLYVHACGINPESQRPR